MASRQELQALAVAKERLVREGELYRLSALRSKHEVINALQPQALLHGAVDQAIGTLQSRLGAFIGHGGGLSGISFKTLLPYAVTLGSRPPNQREASFAVEGNGVPSSRAMVRISASSCSFVAGSASCRNHPRCP